VSEAWIERWAEGRTGWHEPDGNAALKRHWRATGRRVLVPLCGKSRDVAWLAAQGNEVIGVELSPLAVEAFFAEHSLRYEIFDGPLPGYRALDAQITIFCGDFFKLHGVRCDAHFDRGALVALPFAMREAYAAQVDALLEPDAERLVITLEYDEEIAAGPPYSIPAAEVRSYWPDLVALEAYDDIHNGPPKFREAGLDTMIETVWGSR